MKFVQITSCRVDNNQSTQCNWVLHALDDKGYLWELDDVHGWREVPIPIPAPASSEERCQCGCLMPAPTYPCGACGRVALQHGTEHG